MGTFQKLKDLRKNAANITELNLMYETPFSDEDIRLFKHITRLYICAYYDLKLEGIGQFANLEYLRISECDIKQWVLEPFLLPNLKQVELRWNESSRKNNALYQKLLRKVVLEQYPPEIRTILFYLVADDKKQLSEYTTIQFLEAMVCDMPEIQAAIEKEFERRKENPLKDFPLTNKSTIYITGKLHTPLAQMKERLQAQGIAVTGKINEKTTHAIIGKKPKKSPAELAKRNITLLLESQVTCFLNQTDTPYLMDESVSSKPTMINNAVDMLMSDDEANQLTAIEILKKGGVTNEVLPHLAALRYLRVTTKVGNAAKALINQYGSPAAKSAITKNIRFDTSVNEPTIYTNINKVTKGTEMDGLVFAYHLFQKTGKGRKYLLDKGTSEMRKEVIGKSLKKDGTRLDLSDVHFTRFPEEIYDYPNLQEITLLKHSCKKLPAGIGTLKKLEKLNLYGAPIEEIPDDLFTLPIKKLFITVEDETSITNAFTELPLEELYIFYSKDMKNFPKDILQISTLKKLSISSNFFFSPDKDQLLSSIPEEIAQLKELDTIYLEFNNLKKLPESLGTLPKLKAISLFNNPDLEEIPTSFKNSKSLETFYIYSNEWIKIKRETLEASLPPQCKIETNHFNWDKKLRE